MVYFSGRSWTLFQLLYTRNKPLSHLPIMIKGSSPGDNGNLLLDTDERDTLVASTNTANSFLKKYIGAQEFLNSAYRYCIYVTNENVDEVYEIKE